MKLFRKHKESGQSTGDRTSVSASSLQALLRTLNTNGLHALKDMTDEERRIVWDWSKKVIRRYRKTLEKNPSNIRPAEDLPFPKEDIKLAIKLSLPVYAQKDLFGMVKNLKNIYKELGGFQSLDAGDKAKLRKTSGGRDKDSAQPYREMLGIHEKYMEIIVSEKKSLFEEINNFVNRMEALRQRQG